VVRLTATFTDSAGALTTPASPVVNVTTPAGVTTAYAATVDSLGKYHYDYTPTTSGSYTWWFSGTGVAQLPDILTVTAASSSALVSLADVKAQLNITSSTNDVELWGYIQAATEIINRKCGYTASTVFTETVNFGRADSSGNATAVLSRTPVLTVTSITSQMQGLPTYDVTGLVVNSEAGLIYFSNWFYFYGPVTVVYTAGRGFVPPALQTACLIIVQDMWRTQRGGGMAVPGQGGNEDSTTPGDYGIPYRALQLMEMTPYDAAPGIA